LLLKIFWRKEAYLTVKIKWSLPLILDFVWYVIFIFIFLHCLSRKNKFFWYNITFYLLFRVD
jgi:hypothetical protein